MNAVDLQSLVDFLVGFVAAAISIVLWLPQARVTWAHRFDPVAMSAISISTQLLVTCNALIWGLYAVVTRAWWIGVPGLVNLPLALLTIHLVRRSRRKHPQAHVRSICGCGWEGLEAHDFLVTSPPGFGTIISPCDGRPEACQGIPVSRDQARRLREEYARSM